MSPPGAPADVPAASDVPTPAPATLPPSVAGGAAPTLAVPVQSGAVPPQANETVVVPDRPVVVDLTGSGATGAEAPADATVQTPREPRP